MKFDIKNILLLILLSTTIVFAILWSKSDKSEYKKEVNKLRLENEILQQKRDSIHNRIKLLESDYLILKQNELQLINKISLLEKDINDAKRKAEKSKDELDRLRLELEETKKKIEELKKNPPNRTGDDLINSLRNKTK